MARDESKTELSGNVLQMKVRLYNLVKHLVLTLFITLNLFSEPLYCVQYLLYVRVMR